MKIRSISFIDWFFPVSMILAQYKIGGSFSSYGFVIILIYSSIVFLRKKRRIFINKPLLIFTIFSIFIAYINTLRLDLPLEYFVKHMLFSLLLILCLSVLISRINFDNLYKAYKIIGLIVGSAMVLQFINLFLFNKPATPITILPVAIDDYNYWGYFNGLRPSSFFTEPEAYCSFMFPLVIMTIFKREFLLTFFFSLTILMSTSSLGIGLVSIILILNRFLNQKNKSIIPVFIILFFGYIFISYDVFEFAKGKILSIDISSDIRLSRGYIIFSNFNFVDAFFGIDRTIQSYVFKNLNYTWVKEHIINNSEHLLGYVTTYSGVLVKYGVISFFIFNAVLYKLFKNEDKEFRILFFVIIILTLSRTLMFNYWFLFYYTIYLGLCDKHRYNKNYIILK